MRCTTGSARTKLATAGGFPFALGAGLVVGTAVAGTTDLMLGVFVGVMFGAVFVRRFGMPFVIYGFMGWMGYFFASFLGATFASLPSYLEDAAVGTAWVVLVSVTVLRSRPRAVLVRTARGRRPARPCRRRGGCLAARPAAQRTAPSAAAQRRPPLGGCAHCRGPTG